MAEEDTEERKRIRDVIKEDALETREELSGKLRASWSRPVYLLFVIGGAILGLAINNVARRIVDSMLDEPQVVQLDTDLQAASEELQESADEIKSLVADIEAKAAADPALKEEFAVLQGRLIGLTALVAKTSEQTEKVASISEALREDWQRNRRAADRKIDSVPDLVLGSGDAVRVCNGIASVGVTATDTNEGSVQLKVKDWTYQVKPAQRVPLEGGAAVDFIGLDGGNAKLQISCP
ncbi:MAG: hypothetical protein JSV45_08920 [Chromatiales bacterium]|nr:MAG: hypothetical protein JSV45_08920 [Chromatiales bacterium]